MKKLIFTVFMGFLLAITAHGQPSNAAHNGGSKKHKHALPMIVAADGLTFGKINYTAALSVDEARFALDIDCVATNKNESFAELLEGDVAVLTSDLPKSLSIVRDGGRYMLVASRPGEFKFKLDIVAKIERDEPWNRISFLGPDATIESITAQADGADTEIQLLNGTLLNAIKTNGVSRLTGYLGANQMVSLQWQPKVTEVSHSALLTVDSTITAEVTAAVVKYTSKFRYNVVQGRASGIKLSLPADQTLIKLDGLQIRDWNLATEGDHQILTVEFIKPVEGDYTLALSTEQTVDGVKSSLNPPQPMNVDHESGSLVISAENTLVDISTPAGLRQVNAPSGAIAAYDFDVRPLTLTLKLSAIQPEINVADRVNVQLEEARLVVSHRLTLDVEKAGIYTLELTPQSGFVVADIHGDGVEDWNVSDGKIRVDFSGRVLGASEINVQLEQSLKNFPEKIGIKPLHVTGAANEAAQIGAAAAPGIRLRSGVLAGLREIPVDRLPNRSNEILAYIATQPGWNLSIATEHLAPRVVADILNLVTIGDDIAGGSATIRYGLVNQGVQEFKITIPANFKNVEFTGPNIRSKEFANGVWTIGLQDKVWGGYTLVVTYDYQFDSSGATLPVGGIHALDVERETGSIAITTAANLQINPKSVSDSLRRIDQTELSAADRSLITRAVLLAYQYTGDQYDLAVEVNHFPEEPVLQAVADRTQITSVLTESGEMLTQASFMVKNNEKQFQRFQLPSNARLWGCYVDGQPVKPQDDNGWVLVPLPRDMDRDQAFAVDIMYAQTNGALASTMGKSLDLNAPRTDVPNTYGEWQLFVPAGFRLSHFGGSMSVAEGTTYGMLDAWEKFLAFYGQVLREAGSVMPILGFLAFLVIAFVISAVRRGWNGIITLFVVVVILTVLGGMLLPVLSSAKRRAQRINSVSCLKQVGLATRIFARDNNNRLPTSFEEMSSELGSDKVTIDPQTGQRFIYLGGGMSLGSLSPDSVLAYSPMVNGGCNVLYADGNVTELSASGFQQLSQRGLVQVITPAGISGEREEIVTNGMSNMAAMPPPPVTQAPVESAEVFQSAGPALQPVPPTFAQRMHRTPTMGLAGNNTGLPADTAVGQTFAPSAPPVVAGVRSIRIELPQTGQPFLFTKVLNIRDEPLSISAHIMPLSTYQTFQMAWQTAAFLVGLFLWWLQWHRVHRSSFVQAIALTLIIGSVCSLLVQWRALHGALIIGFPLVMLAMVALLIWKYWPRRANKKTVTEETAPEPPPIMGSVPPVAAAIALLLTVGLTAANAANVTGPYSQAGSIVSANYSGTVNDRVASVEATFEFAPAQKSLTVPLFGSDVAVQQFTVKNGKAELVRDGNTLSVRLGSRGSVTLTIKMLIKTDGDITKRRLNFNIPPALTSQVAFVLDEAGADVDFPTAISFKRVLEKDKTRVEAVMGSASAVDLLWTPRMKQAGEVAATVFCQNAALVTFGGGVVNVCATMDYQITQGEMRQARVQLPAGQRLLRVEGTGIRTWEIKNENGGQVLVVDLLKGMSPSWRLTVEMERNLDTFPASVAIAVPHALEVKRETGFVALRGSEELALSVESTSGLERVDAREFPGSDNGNGLFSVFQFSRPEFAMRTRVETIRPEIEAVALNSFRVSAEQVSLATTVDYTIKRAGVFTLELALPEDYHVDNVNGDGIQQQNERDNQGSHTLVVTLKARTMGGYHLVVQLSRDLKELPKSLAITGVQAQGVDRLTGYVAVSAEPGVSVKTESFDGLIEIPAVSLPDANVAANGNVLAYKFISAGLDAHSNVGGTRPNWSLSVQTEKVDAWVRAEIVNTISLTETLVDGRAMIRYDIANAPVKELRVRVPENFQNVEIAGPNIRSREQDGNVWRIELQNPVRGHCNLTVTWEQPRSAKTNVMEFAGVSAEGVERESGLLAISAKAPMQVGELGATDLQRVDVSDIPDWFDAPDSGAALVYRYVRPGYKLSLDVRRLDDAEVLQAIVEDAQLTSVVADDGQMMTKMSLSLQSNGRQFLQVNLPAGATVWSAFVAGQPVRPGVRDGKLLLPIEQSVTDDGTTSVELTYTGTNFFPRAKGQVSFVSPQFDVPLKSAHWEVYLPPDYDYENFQGTMTRETAPAPEPVSTSFSSLDYSMMEEESKSAAKVEATRDVDEARRKLARGDVQGATATFYRARNLGLNDSLDTGADDLKKDLQNAQASNLIAAQNDFTARNSWNLSDNESTVDRPKAGLQYDNAAAGEQWNKLQQAQEIVTAKIQPLHVNLPVRGSHYEFTQVLQTETGKPMTVELFAANTKAVNWPLRGLAAAGAFLALWTAIIIMSRLTLRFKMNESQAV